MERIIMGSNGSVKGGNMAFVEVDRKEITVKVAEELPPPPSPVAGIILPLLGVTALTVGVVALAKRRKA